ncbi:MAG: TIGR04551 family protein [Myxococcota bacterium]|nr:TIGR04551 family protein [Myxococcota bacterium]
MNRLILALSSVLFCMPSLANAEDDGQLDAAKKAGEAAAKASGDKSAAKTNKAPAKKTKSKLSFGSDLSWGQAANSKQTRATAPGHDLKANWNAALGPVSNIGYPWIEQHGTFRFRTQMFYNFDLDTYRTNAALQSSPFMPPLTQTDQRIRRDGESQSSANMRLRYQPTVHISDALRIRATMDIFDNLILGSTPDGGPHAQRSLGSTSDVLARNDVQLEVFEDGQRPPESGVNSWRDSVRMKRLWGEWKTPLGLVAMGRMPSHWGLGMIANDGNCLDCDFGDSVDRLMGATKIADTYVAVTWDFPSEGATGFSGNQTARNQPGGQAYDFDQRDDANQFVVALFRKPISREEQEKRIRRLNQERKPVFDWGVYNRIRTQSLESGYQPPAPAESSAGTELYEVDAYTYTPDLWLKFEYRPAKGINYRIEFEGAATFGSIKEVPLLFNEDAEGCVDPTEELPACESWRLRERQIQRFGYALHFDAQHEAIHWGLHHGLASGDSNGSFGRLIGSEINLPRAGTTDKDLTAFYFDRDYLVDRIMFRQMLGGVSNATYFKPYLRYDFIQEDAEAWGFQLSSIYGYALEEDATPGKANSLGLEMDIELFIEEFDRFRWSFAYAVFFPMAAFDVRDSTSDRNLLAEPSAAQLLQMNFGFQF